MEKVAISHPTLKGNSASSFFLSIKEFLVTILKSLRVRTGRKKQHDNSDRSEGSSCFSCSIKAIAILSYFVAK